MAAAWRWAAGAWRPFTDQGYGGQVLCDGGEALVPVRGVAAGLAASCGVGVWPPMAGPHPTGVPVNIFLLLFSPLFCVIACYCVMGWGSRQRRVLGVMVVPSVRGKRWGFGPMRTPVVSQWTQHTMTGGTDGCYRLAPRPVVDDANPRQDSFPLARPFPSHPPFFPPFSSRTELSRPANHRGGPTALHRPWNIDRRAAVPTEAELPPTLGHVVQRSTWSSSSMHCVLSCM